MDFDIANVLQDMGNAMVDVTKTDAPKMGKYVKEILSKRSGSLLRLANARKRGEIDEETFQEELIREKEVMKLQLITVKIMTEVAVQKAINAAIDVFTNAVKALI